MVSTTKELSRELPEIVHLHKDGSVECLMGSPNVPLSLDQYQEAGYRLAPEHSLPAATYKDCQQALPWVASHSVGNGTKIEPWLLDHGDFGNVFIGGANIVYKIAVRAGFLRA
ncbi:conserved hypothetical protein [Ricinus communis]|uniref:Alpha/beta hydrolase fold-3 domain-containing protein n=1 Tax=Ricinus communis TaxID=3988 RepID=B9RWC8_RICCO|nr:conserved hypothetical protein [Ricinus communis]